MRNLTLPEENVAIKLCASSELFFVSCMESDRSFILHSMHPVAGKWESFDKEQNNQSYFKMDPRAAQPVQETKSNPQPNTFLWLYLK